MWCSGVVIVDGVFALFLLVVGLVQIEVTHRKLFEERAQALEREIVLLCERIARLEQALQLGACARAQQPRALVRSNRVRSCCTHRIRSVWEDTNRRADGSTVRWSGARTAPEEPEQTEEDRASEADSTDDMREVCCICLCPLDTESPLTRSLSCDHLMHHSCIKSWEDTGKNTCPKCRAVVLHPPYLSVEYPVIEITRRRYDFRSDRYYYKVRWALSPRSVADGVAEYTWEPERNLTHCDVLLEEFERNNPRSAVRRSPRLADRSAALTA